MTDLDRLRRLVADHHVGEVYDTERGQRPFDTTRRRRQRALDDEHRQIIQLATRLEIGRDLDDVENHLGMTYDELVEAFGRTCKRMLRGFVSRAVVDSLEGARVWISDELGDGLDDPDSAEIVRPTLLWEYIDGRRESYPSGASRAR